MADYQTFEKLYYCSAHQDSGLATSDISISSSNPRCYRIYLYITLKELSVSRQITSFLKIMGCSFLGVWLKGTRKDMGRESKMSIL